MDPTTKPPPTARSGSSVAAPAQPWLHWAALGAVVAVFGVVRFGCLFNDLWLDEIWSLQLIEDLKSPVEIITRVAHDNNHPLNSLFLYLLMPAKADWTYRLLSWFMGTATVWLAGLIARGQFQRLHPGEGAGRARAAGLITATICGGSYLLIHYSSEARGYAPAVGFVFLAFYALLRSSGRPVSAWAAVYGLACLLGLLSHLVAFQVMLAGLVWSVANVFRTWDRWRDRLLHLACWHLVPWTFLGLYYFAFVRKVEIGGGPANPLAGVLGDLAAFSLGFPRRMGVFTALPVFLALSFIVLGLIWRRDRALAYFYGAAIFLAPVLAVCSSHFVLLFPRYFIVSAACALLLAGYALTRFWNSPGALRAVCLAVLAAFLLGNGAHTLRLMRFGRGQYQLALRHIAGRTPTTAITVSGDSDLRNVLVGGYHTKVLGFDRRFEYYPGSQLPPQGSQWLLLPRLDGETPPSAGLLEVGRLRYQLENVYRHAALSGWDWYLYRNLDPAVLAPRSP